MSRSVGQNIKMIRLCTESDFKQIFEIINDAAHAYKGIIPEDRWHEPYMPFDELRKEIENGVIFWGLEHDGQLLGVMGIQDKGEATLIRHAYVSTQAQKLGIGTKLLKYLEGLTENPVLIGTWAAASWAISFYEKNGYVLVSEKEKNFLLRKYWSIPERQVETSVVLAKRTCKRAQP
jgi:GNAT superfamily N-acetyltransferase